MSNYHPTTELDNTTPLRKKDLQDPTVVQAVESMGANSDDVGTSHPQEDADRNAKEVRKANTPATISGGEARAGGKSEVAAGHGLACNYVHGPNEQLPGGAKGSSGPGATAGGPFQSESGQTLETGKDYQKPDPAT